MYSVKIYRMGPVTDFEYTWSGNYGKKGEKRAPKQKRTKKEVELQNRIKKARKIKREILANFEKGDCWVTLTYKKGTRKSIEEVKKDVSNLTDKLRPAYKKQGKELKWMKLIEVGSRGGIHVHILLNRVRGEPDTMDMLEEFWKNGHVNIKSLYDFRGDCNFEQLADYIAKVPEEQEHRADKMQEVKVGKNYIFGTSRNLIRPEPEKKVYTRRTMRKILEEGPKVQEGFYLDKSTWRQGINKFTGYSYLYYSEVRLEQGREKSSGG